MIPLLHLPLDFERREDVRRLGRALGNQEMALNIALLIWLDWGRAGVEFRLLKFAPKQSGYPWKDDDLTFVIEDLFCGDGKGRVPGAIITKAIEATLLRTEQRGAVWGLVLNDFWRFNSHLSPSHRTIQQKGAIAKHSRKEARDLELAAAKQIELIRSQGHLVFESAVADADETKRSIALVMRFDRACDKPLRGTSDYTEQTSLMATALRVIRAHSNDDINRVCEYVIANRENPRLVKLPERLLEKFDDLLRKASDGV